MRRGARLGILVATAMMATMTATACSRGDEPARPSPSPSQSSTRQTPTPTPSASTASPTPSSQSPTPTPTPSLPRSITPPKRPSSTPTIAQPPDGAPCVPPALLGKDLTTVSSAKVIALTFDGGAANTGVDRILATLASTNTPATFFLTGAFAQKFPADARRIAAAHPVGNHSQTHPYFTRLSADQIGRELDTARANIMTATGQDPRPYFRFPYGDVNATAIRVVNANCYVPFRWTTDSLGWKGTSGGMTADSVRQRVVNGARPGGIVLMHVGANPDDGTTLDADALPGIISDLRAAGYGFVTLEAVLPAAP